MSDSISPGSSSSSLGSGSSSSQGTPDLAPPPPPPPPPPPVPSCEDATHCNTAGVVCGGMLRNCPGFLDDGTNFTYSLVMHPAGPGLMGFNAQVCDQCALHDDPNPLQQKRHRVLTWADANAASGNLAQLCHSCIRDEMRLYWQRIKLNDAVLPPDAAPSLGSVLQWPTAALRDQNLCVCNHDAIARFSHYCHRCRDVAFSSTFVDPYLANELVLRTKDKATITGRVVSAVGAPDHNVTPQTIQDRVLNQIGRMCPCGNQPKRPSFPEYIGYCLCCSGVKIVAHNIPRRYRPPVMKPEPLVPRRSPRGHASSAPSRTKGPTSALRSHIHRVNIERGWRNPDPLVGNN